MERTIPTEDSDVFTEEVAGRVEGEKAVDPERVAPQDLDPQETQEWIESLDSVLEHYGPERLHFLLERLQERALSRGVAPPFSANTPYINTIPVAHQPGYPGSRELERRIKSIIRWNAMAMVVRANKESAGIGGHISTYASAATLYEVAFNHFFHGPGEDGYSGDIIHFQGHASPGIYARAYLEGRLDERYLENFRRELAEGGGLSSYPHPWHMPNFWQFPTVSMGLGPISAIYQARFNRYLEARSLKPVDDRKVFCFMGDGECDEPESLGALTLAAREKLDNLIFVINCNLQRLDGPVRGNHKIIQELEAAFRGAGWNVIKVIWGSDWDPLLAADETGELVRRMGEAVDGEYQKLVVEDGAYARDKFFTSPGLKKLVEHLSDDELWRLRRGGHDPVKVHAAYKSAVEHKGQPTVILAKTIKGYGLGEAGEGRNVTHQQKKLNEEELREFRTRFGIPISDDKVVEAPFYLPPENSPEIAYLRQRRETMGGFVPSRPASAPPVETPELETFAEFFKGSNDRPASTTMAFVRTFGQLLKQKQLSKLLVPIIPDEARTFGMESLFRQIGIYSSVGQRYEPVDRDTLLYYREVKDGQILEEGITEAGSMASFLAAGTAYSTHGVNMIPFFIFYSMFGFQRVGDLIWAAADARVRGFLMGATAGRTTLNGEGLQHQDGHSHVLAATVPNLCCYDPAFAYETAVIIQDGLKRMYRDQESIFYYVTLYNEAYPMPPMPRGVEEGIRRGLYRFKSKAVDGEKARVQLFGSGPILREVLRAQEILAERFQIASDVWSVPSYKELRRDALEAERWNRLHPSETPQSCHLWKSLEGVDGPFIASTDYLRLVPEQIARWVPGRFVPLGTDGFGRSESREALRRFFEMDGECIALASLEALVDEGRLERSILAQAVRELGIDPDKRDPMTT